MPSWTQTAQAHARHNRSPLYAWTFAIPIVVPSVFAVTGITVLGLVPPRFAAAVAIVFVRITTRGVVDEGWPGYHGASIAHGCS
jgi:hypothetical protein